MMGEPSRQTVFLLTGVPGVAVFRRLGDLRASIFVNGTLAVSQIRGEKRTAGGGTRPKNTDSIRRHSQYCVDSSLFVAEDRVCPQIPLPEGFSPYSCLYQGSGGKYMIYKCSDKVQQRFTDPFGTTSAVTSTGVYCPHPHPVSADGNSNCRVGKDRFTISGSGFRATYIDLGILRVMIFSSALYCLLL